MNAIPSPLFRLPSLLGRIVLIITREDKKEIFRYPVTADIAPGYFDVVKQPMDLTTMRRKLDEGAYKEAQPFWVIWGGGGRGRKTFGLCLLVLLAQNNPVIKLT